MSRLEHEGWKPAVEVVTWFLMTTAILCVVTRLGTKYWIFRRWTPDDYLSILSMIFCAAQSLAVSMATVNGYGKHYTTLSKETIDAILKSAYAAGILFIVTMCLSKLALIQFIWSITPAASDRRTAIGLEVSTGLWAAIGVLVSAFECKPPRTWDLENGHCFNVGAWWNYLSISNILLEIGIIIQALLIIVGVHAHWTKKATLTSIFGLRIFVIFALVGQIVCTNRTRSSDDPTFDTWSATISTQIVQCLSVVTSCSPQFKPFMDSLRSTGMRIDGLTSYNMTSAKGYELSSLRQRSAMRGNEAHELMSMNTIRSQHHTSIIASGALSDGDNDGDSQSSQTHIIKETRTFTVTESVRGV
ncbi:hypothetical protein BDV25DRAFT_38568 [Aspergillus avenaceus]|uniref:Rhodopsin domain-containing protein n=1 Tax=Aspergillus avenaceus TaxID=36643 RepID=A0A5N6U4N5_ASPAV|nr:hypothetical protein BDV25DRAFT_38568 [Aspergillus avenaceus]